MLFRLAGRANFRTAFSTGLWAVWLLALVLFTNSSAQVPFECTTPEIVLGSFSATDPSDNLWTAGATQFRFQSEIPWELVGRLTEPVRRVSDGLELPMERVRTLFHDVGEEFASFEYFVIDYGQGLVLENQAVEFGWEVLQLRVADFIEAGDPPGVYRTTVDFALRDRVGERISDRLIVLFEFEILSWIEVELPQAGLQLIVTDQNLPAHADPLSIQVRSNAAWQFRLTWSSDLIDLISGETIATRFVDWKIAANEGYQTLIPDFVPVSIVSVEVASADAPEPFSISEMSIPVEIQCDALGLMAGGNYGADFSADVSVFEEVR